MPQYDTHNLTDAAIGRLDDCTDPRFKEVMSSLIRHLHDFAREVDLKEDEWFNALQFLVETGKKCTENRHEFILLSDTLGLSMLVVALAQARKGDVAEGATPGTEATVQGPFYWPGAPEMPLGGDIGEGVPGEPAYYSGRVLDLNGKPIANALLDVWSGDGEGFYDMQREDGGMHARARIRTDDQGRYWFWSILPSFYPVPDDGPVGAMLRRMGRHPNRPGHIHMMVSAEGHVPVTTHLFVSDSLYLDSDAVFGVRDSLIVQFEHHPAGRAPDGREMKKPYASASYDFKLVPEKVAA
jgi:hydroxyquinol 1,2-dioxygenase